MRRNRLVVVRGAGDIATGAIQKLVRAGFSVLALETGQPSAIRRQVALCEAVYEDKWTVEDMTAIRVESLSEAWMAIESDKVPIMIDPGCNILKEAKPAAVVDAILAKKNLGTTKDMAPVTVALGPGFVAGTDVDAVIETMRGHHLGRLFLVGSAAPDSGTPGIIAGVGKERVIHAPCEGRIHLCESYRGLRKKRRNNRCH